MPTLIKRCIDYYCLFERARLRMAYTRMFHRCTQRGLNGPRHDPIDQAITDWLRRCLF